MQLTDISPEVLSEETSQENTTDTNFRASSLAIGKIQELFVTHLESPREVYFMKATDLESFKSCIDQIHKKAESLECQAAFSPAVGSLVLVKASDHCWYRGEVLSITDPSHLRFYAVDFGFTEMVERKQVRDIPATLSSWKTHHYIGKIF